MSKSELLDKFEQTLEDHGDEYFSFGDDEQDYEQVMGTIKVQGYWSGVSLRYYFDEEFNLINTEERRFG